MLSVSALVRVTVNLTPTAVVGRSFGVLMIAGDSNVVNGTQRFKTYLGIDGVAVDFGTDKPEYKAAALFFGQSPKPPSCMIGRWFRTASSAENVGEILTPAEQVISNWTSISNGGFVISIDGTPVTLTGLDFTSVTNLNGVASVITAALSGGQTCVWNGTNFIISSGTTGAGAKATGTISLTGNPSPGVQASGTITLTGQPSNGDTVVIKGTTVTFVSGTPSGNEVKIGVADTDTAANLQQFLQGSADVNLSANTYNTIGLVTTITARAYGTAGNSYGLTKSGANITVSGSGNLAGGVAANTLTVDGTTVTFVAVTPSGNQVLVGATASATAANLQAFLTASSDSNILNATYSTSGTVTTVTAAVAGTAGNSFTLAKSGANISVSATLSGGLVPSSVGYATTGSGTDISAQLGLTSATAQALVPGFNSETPVQCTAVLANLSPAWYGLMFAASTQPTDNQSLAVSDFIEALDLTRLYGVTIQNTNAESALVTNDLASLMKAAGYNQSFNQFSSSNAYAVASVFGRAFSVDFTQDNSTIILMFKQEPGVVAEDLDANTALVLKSKNCNVFAQYDDDTMILQYGVVSSGQFIDTIHGTDWLQNAIQTAVYNVLYTTPKVPQTDPGVNKLVNSINGVCGQAVNNGLVAPGVWNGPAFGQLVTGQFLKQGYYTFAESVNDQSEADRQTRVCPPIQVAVKLAGGIQSVDILVDVNS